MLRVLSQRSSTRSCKLSSVLSMPEIAAREHPPSNAKMESIRADRFVRAIDSAAGRRKKDSWAFRDGCPSGGPPQRTADTPVASFSQLLERGGGRFAQRPGAG